jgi:hypothetical protein
VKPFAIVWIVVAAAASLALARAAGGASTNMIATVGCIGIPCLAFGVRGPYQELKP